MTSTSSPGPPGDIVTPDFPSWKSGRPDFQVCASAFPGCHLRAALSAVHRGVSCGEGGLHGPNAGSVCTSLEAAIALCQSLYPAWKIGPGSSSLLSGITRSINRYARWPMPYRIQLVAQRRYFMGRSLSCVDQVGSASRNSADSPRTYSNDLRRRARYSSTTMIAVVCRSVMVAVAPYTDA